MISKEQYTAIRQLKAEGFTGTVIAQKLNLSAVSVRKWWNTDKKTFDQLIRGNTPYMDQYREFILSIFVSARKFERRICYTVLKKNFRTSTATSGPFTAI